MYHYNALQVAYVDYPDSTGEPVTVNHLFWGSMAGRSTQGLEMGPGNRLYFGSSGGVTIIDVSNPAAPVEHAEAPLPSDIDLQFARGIGTVDDLVLFVAAEGHLVAYDVSNWDAPSQIGDPLRIAYQNPDAQDLAMRPAPDGDYVYVAGADGLTVIDVSDPENMIRRGNIEVLGLSDQGANVDWVGDPESSGDDYVVTMSRYSGLHTVHVLDDADPLIRPDTPPVYIGEEHRIGDPLPAYTPRAQDVLYDDGYAYVTDDDWGLVVFELEKVSAPNYDVTVIGVPHWLEGDPFLGANSLDKVGDYVYVSAEAPGQGYMQIYDVTDPTDPVPQITPYLQFVSTEVLDIKVQGDYAYLTAANHFYVVDISDPTSPTVTCDLWTNVWGGNLQIVSTKAYFSHVGGFKVVDISDPYNASEAFAYAPGSGRSYHAMGTNGETVWLVCDFWIEAINIESESQVGELHLPEQWTQGHADMDVVGNWLYVVMGTAGVYVIDSTYPGYMVFHGACDPFSPYQIHPSFTNGLHVTDDLIFLADGQSGLKVLAGNSEDLTPFGACCFDDAPCLQTYEILCLNSEGVWAGDGTDCDLDGCSQVEGACCHDYGNCDVLTEEDCANANRTFLGYGIPCDEPNPCPQPDAACCFLDGSCTLVTDADCTAAGGAWHGPGSVCDPNPCPQPDAACCRPDGTCAMVTEQDCLDVGGTWQGYPTECTTTLCPAACCLPDGSCTFVTETDCAAAGGMPHGYETHCDPNPCPQPAVCCFLDQDCQLLLEGDCVLAGGTWFSYAESCDPDPCETLDVDDSAPLPTTYALYGGAPNPFRMNTSIRYDLPEATSVSLHVYDLTGHVVRTMAKGVFHEPGRHRVIWDGNDNLGRPLGSGVYFVGFESDAYRMTRSITLLR